MVKLCRWCEQEKDESCFAKNKAKKDGLQAYCRSCKKEMDSKYYSSNKDLQLRRVNEKYHADKTWVDSIKEKSGCVVCGEKDAACLDFHHCAGKDYAISSMLRSYSRESILLEIAKCVVICANCHRKLHASRFSLLNEK